MPRAPSRSGTCSATWWRGDAEGVVGGGASVDLLPPRAMARRGLLDLEEVLALLVQRDHRRAAALLGEADAHGAAVVTQGPAGAAGRAVDHGAAQHDDVEMTHRADARLAAVLDLLERPPELRGDVAPEQRGTLQRRVFEHDRLR